MIARLWLGRTAASLILVLGVLVFSSAVETGSILLFAVSALGIGGAVLLILGIERAAHPLARAARVLGWVMMFAFSLIPTSLLFVPALVVVLAFPSLNVRATPGTPGAGAHGPDPTS